MKKIVFAVTTDLNYDQRMQRICGSLTRNGYSVLIIGREWPDSEKLQPTAYQQHRLTCFFHKGKLFYLEYSLRLLWYLLFRSFDAYCAVDLDTALPVYFNARLNRKPFIFDAHEYFTELIEVVDRPFIKKIWTVIERFIITRTKLAYTVNQSLAKQYFDAYQLKFEVIRNCAVLENNTTLHKNQNEKFLLYQGAVNTGRGLEAVVKALPIINLKLVICGKGDIYEPLKDLVNSLNVNHLVVFKGYMLPHELSKLTRQAFIGINLLENKGLSYYYSLSNKFFDYIHAGTPQLISNFPEYMTLNNQYKVAQVVSLEPTKIAAAVNTLLQDEAKYNELVKNCLLARKGLNWQNEEKKLLTFYENVWR